MGEETNIAWADDTFNPVIGCQEVSPACDRCYAKVQNEFFHWVKGWGPKGERRRTAISNWKKPLAWNNSAARLGLRRRVFGPSLADPFDNQWETEWRDDYFTLIKNTPNLDWLLLTKRPENAPKMLPPDWGHGYPNVWLGVTAEDMEWYERRMKHLSTIPAAVKFVSVEPMLGRFDLASSSYPLADWYIGGGESGEGYRTLDIDAMEDLARDVVAAGKAWFTKQDSHLKSGQQGRISDSLWHHRQFPVAA